MHAAVVKKRTAEVSLAVERPLLMRGLSPETLLMTCCCFGRRGSGTTAIDGRKGEKRLAGLEVGDGPDRWGPPVDE
jgi:hypothetical protein